MRVVCFLLALFVATGAQAYTYDVAPAPALLTGTAGIRVYLAPFVDRRGQRELWRGNDRLETVEVEAEGLTSQAKVWSRWDYASMSFLWQRQLGQALAGAGFAVEEAPEPVPDSVLLFQQARGTGALYLVDGDILRVDMGKRGSDQVFGTNFSGTDYSLSMEANVAVYDAASGKQVFKKDWSCEQWFHDPIKLGRRDRDTFPAYFAAGLAQAARGLAQDAGLRAAVGLAPTPTPIPTPQPDDGKPYWVNPKTGKRMDPSWNFDPSDGTPSKDFVLKQPAAPTFQATPTESRP
jgi:hypothetical protein